MDCVDLKNEWVLWYHSINDNNWNKQSYKKLFSLKDLYHVNLILDTFKQTIIKMVCFF